MRLFYYLIFTILVSCNHGGPIKVVNIGRDTFLEKIGRQVYISPLSSDKNIKSIRIWIWDLKNYVVTIVSDGKDSSCQIVSWDSLQPHSAHDPFIRKEWKNLKPESGWDNFFRQMNNYQIYQMNPGKSYEDLPTRLTEMSVVQFEIVKDGHYRMYQYYQPSFFRYVDTGSHKINDFLLFMNNEFGVPAYQEVQHPYLEKGFKY
jgi:hypothetical protein